MIQDFNLFDDNTLCITITLAEYRELIQHQAMAEHEICRLRGQLEQCNCTQNDMAEQIHALQSRLMAETDDLDA